MRSFFPTHLASKSLHPPAQRSGLTGWGLIFAVASMAFFAIRSFAQTPANTETHPSNVSTFPSPSSSIVPQNSGTTPSTTVAVPNADQSHYIISPGDVLEVSIFDAPDLSQKAVVDSTGNIYLPLINHVQVAGMHVEDAQRVVENEYLVRGVLKSPHISIFITSYAMGVDLMGEVARPGVYPIVGSGKLFDVLTEAGGTTANAGQTVTITHKGNTAPEIVTLTNDPVKSFSSNVSVHQGDTVIVSKAGVLYVVGEVLSPSGFLMDEKGQYTVMKALAMAHGTTKFAKTSKARIVRRTPEGQQEIPVPLDKILLAKAPDIPMQSNDILFIPTSKGKEAAARSAEVAISLAGAVGYYGVTRF